MLKLKILILLFVLLIGLSSCNNVENSVKPTVNDLETVSVKFYYFDKDDSIGDVTKYKINDISVENLSKETVEFMDLYNGIQINSVWYEGTKICVDLNPSEFLELDKGSSAGFIRKSILLKTFSSYPNVKEIEILVGGEKGCVGDLSRLIKLLK